MYYIEGNPIVSWFPAFANKRHAPLQKETIAKTFL